MNRLHTFLALFALVGAATSGCSSTQAGGAQRPVTPGGHNVITESELQASQDATLYDTINRLRPSFLRTRTQTTLLVEDVHVFIDGTRAEGLNSLRQYTPKNVKEVRFYEPNDANVRFGTGHNGGLIAVTLLR